MTAPVSEQGDEGANEVDGAGEGEWAAVWVAGALTAVEEERSGIAGKAWGGCRR